MVKVIFGKATAKNKKMKAVFYDGDKKIKTVQFGQLGADDYTLTKDKEQRARYIKRHTNSRENWSIITLYSVGGFHICAK